MADIISTRMLAFERGRKAFKDGRPRPENRWTDAEWEPWFSELEPGQLEWLGWMAARAAQLLRQDKLREWAEEGGDLPPNY